MLSATGSGRRRGRNGRFAASKPLDVQLTSVGRGSGRCISTSPRVRSRNFRFADVDTRVGPAPQVTPLGVSPTDELEQAPTYNVRMSSFDRRQFLAQMAAAPGGQSPPVSPTRPRNVLLMIADDLGLFLPSYGDPNASMPRIEQTAREGGRFENAFCTTASCSASRSVILSGLYNHANGQYGHAHGEHHFSFLPEIRPMPRLLKDAGYATGYIGKLHVAPEERFGWDLADPI